MKSKEELNALKEKIQTVNKKLAELTEEELKQVSGGANEVGYRTLCWETLYCSEQTSDLPTFPKE